MNSPHGIERAGSWRGSQKAHQGRTILPIGFLLVAEVVFLGSGYATQRLFNGLPPYVLTDAGEAGLLGFTLIMLRTRGYFGRIGLNGPSKWVDLRVLWLPTLYTTFFLLGSVGEAKGASGPLIASVLLSATIVGLSEELTFRGFVLESLLPGGLERAVVVSSIVFGLFHFNNLVQAGGGGTVGSVSVQVLFAALFGIGFASFRLRTGTIWPVVAFHVFSDFPAFFLQNSTGSTSSLNPMTVAIELLLGGTIAVYGLYLLRSTRRKTK